MLIGFNYYSNGLFRHLDILVVFIDWLTSYNIYIYVYISQNFTVLSVFSGANSANASSQDQNGDGAESGNISRHQKRVQAAAAAASIYQKSFVYPSPSTLTWYTLYNNCCHFMTY